MSSKLIRTALLTGVAGAALMAAAQAQAAVVYLNIADINPAIGGIMGFDGTAMQSIGGTDDLRVSVGPAVFANAQFNITSGWTVGRTVIRDRDGSNSVTAGDSVSANIGTGTFQLVNPDGVLVIGSFTNAVLNTTVGSTTVNINSSDANGLDLTPGPVLTALGYASFDPSEALAISLIGIAPGVAINPGATQIGATPFFNGTMAAFGLGQNVPTSGSVDMVADLIPEPASVGLLGLAAIGLVSRRRGATAKKLAALALAVGGAVAMSGTQAHAAPVNMNLSDINAPIGGIAGFDGSNFVSLGGTDTFVITGFPSFANASLVINSGFAVSNTTVIDLDLDNAADAGEPIFGDVGAGTFSIVNPGGVILTGTFTSAGYSTSVGSNSLTINAATVNGLNLTPGPLLVGVGITGLFPPEDFSINITNILPGVSVTGVSGTGELAATLSAFGVGQAPSTSGSVNLSAELIPEPASLGLLSVGAMGLIARRRRNA